MKERILFLDIETVSAVPTYADLPSRLQAQWQNKAKNIRRDGNQTDEELFDTKAGIYAEFGKIIVIGLALEATDEQGKTVLRTKTFAHDDERILLKEFSALLNSLDKQTILCAHNGKEFDFPYLCRRLLVNSLPLPPQLQINGKKPWEIPHQDTLELWKFGDYKHYTSLELLCTIFDIPSSKSDMDGGQVNEFYYQQKNLEAIARYCQGDVIALAQLYRRMKGLPLIDPTNIIHT